MFYHITGSACVVGRDPKESSFGVSVCPGDPLEQIGQPAEQSHNACHYLDRRKQHSLNEKFKQVGGVLFNQI